MDKTEVAALGMVFVEPASQASRFSDRVYYSSLLAPSFGDTHTVCLPIRTSSQPKEG